MPWWHNPKSRPEGPIMPLFNQCNQQFIAGGWIPPVDNNSSTGMSI
jgi:hypothetical protein